jgi:type IV secretion system protein VirD4
MIERPLMTPDELKSLPKGTFVVMKTGYHPMKVKLKLYFKWGIKFEEPFIVEEKSNRVVKYAYKEEIIDSIIQKYHPEWFANFKDENNDDNGGGQSQTEHQNEKQVHEEHQSAEGIQEEQEKIDKSFETEHEEQIEDIEPAEVNISPKTSQNKTTPKQLTE